MRRRGRKRMSYLTRLLPRQGWKQLVYALGIFVSAWESWRQSLGLGATILLIVLVARVVDILLTDRAHRRRPSGWETYFDD